MFAGFLKYQWRSCESSRGHKSASRGRGIGNNGRERACIARESATRDLEIVAETVRVFAGPFSYNGGSVSAVETMKGSVEVVRVIIHCKGRENAHSGRRSAQRSCNNVVEAVKVCRGHEKVQVNGLLQALRVVVEAVRVSIEAVSSVDRGHEML